METKHFQSLEVWSSVACTRRRSSLCPSFSLSLPFKRAKKTAANRARWLRGLGSSPARWIQIVVYPTAVRSIVRSFFAQESERVINALHLARAGGPSRGAIRKREREGETIISREPESIVREESDLESRIAVTHERTPLTFPDSRSRTRDRVWVPCVRL